VTPRALGLIAVLLHSPAAAASIEEPAVQRAAPPELSAAPTPLSASTPLSPIAPALEAQAPPASIPPLAAAARASQAPLAPVREAEASGKLADAEISAALFDGARAAQTASRVVLLAQRAATLPAHVWPFSRLASALSHGEGMAGPTAGSAASTTREIARSHGVGAVVGRLSWELHDAWSVRGAVRSYLGLVDELAEAKKRDPKLDVAITLDVEALGAQLDGLPLAERERVAAANARRIALKAREAGIPVEFDVGASAALPVLLSVARSVVLELGMPVRLAVAARYAVSEAVLRAWAALARRMGLTLGVRLVKGSFIEGDSLGAQNFRRPLLEQYKRLVTEALRQGDALDVAVATQNEEIWRHARAEAARLGARYSVQTIRGVNEPLQQKMRAEGAVSREYVSYGLDTPVMGLMEMWTNWRQKRALRRRFPNAEID